MCIWEYKECRRLNTYLSELFLRYETNSLQNGQTVHALSSFKFYISCEWHLPFISLTDFGDILFWMILNIVLILFWVYILADISCCFFQSQQQPLRCFSVSRHLQCNLMCFRTPGIISSSHQTFPVGSSRPIRSSLLLPYLGKIVTDSIGVNGMSIPIFSFPGWRLKNLT